MDFYVLIWKAAMIYDMLLKVLKQDHVLGKRMYVYLRNKVYASRSKQGTIWAEELWEIHTFNFML